MIASGCDDRLWIWHLKFGFLGAMNDLNILDCSPFILEVRTGKRAQFKVAMHIAGRFIDWVYWAVDGIFPTYLVFLKTNLSPSNLREQFFSKAQESFCQGVERLYAVLFSRWHILATPSRIRYIEDMNDVVKCCSIMHNMLIEETDKYGNIGTKCIVSVDPSSENVPVRTQVAPDDVYDAAESYRITADSISDCLDHNMFPDALTNAIWKRHGCNVEAVNVMTVLFRHIPPLPTANSYFLERT